MEKDVADWNREVESYSERMTAAAVLSQQLDREIDQVVHKLGKSLGGLRGEDPEERHVLSEEEREGLLKRLENYAICRDIANEKNRHWAERYRARMRNPGENWYMDLYQIEPPWLIVTKALAKLLFFGSVLAASLVYLYSQYLAHYA